MHQGSHSHLTPSAPKGGPLMGLKPVPHPSASGLLRSGGLWHCPEAAVRAESRAKGPDREVRPLSQGQPLAVRSAWGAHGRGRERCGENDVVFNNLQEALAQDLAHASGTVSGDKKREANDKRNGCSLRRPSRLQQGSDPRSLPREARTVHLGWSQAGFCRPWSTGQMRPTACFCQ